MKNFILLFTTVLLISFQLIAATRTATVTGNWNSTATWGGSAVPVSGDIVNVNQGITVTVDIVNAVCTTLNVNITTNGTAGILKFLNNTCALTVSGDATIGDGSNRNGTLDMTSGGTLKMGGTLALGSKGTFTSGTGTIEYLGTGATQVLLNTSYYNLILSGSGAKTFGNAITAIRGLTLSGTVTASTLANLAVSGNLVVGTGTTFATGTNFTLSVTGTSAISGTLTLAGTGAKTFTGDVTINSGGTWSETGVAAINYGGNLQNDGTYAASTGVHTFSGTTKTISGANAVTFTNMTINGGSFILSKAITVTNFTLTSGTFDAVAYKLTATAATLTAGTLRVSDASWTNNYSFTPTPAAGNTIEYYNNNPTINAAITYQNLQFSGSGTAGVSAALTIQGNLTNTGGGVLDFGANNVILNGAVAANNIAGFTTTGQVSVTKTAGVATFTGNVNGGSLTINGNGTLNLGNSLTHILNGDNSVLAGTLNTGTSTDRVKGNIINQGAHNGNGVTVLTGGSSPHSISGNGTFSSIELDDVNGATVNSNVRLNSLKITSGTFHGNSYTISLTGAGLAWNNANHSFDYGTSTVRMAGTSAQQMYGSTFYDLEINNPAGVTLTSSDIVTHSLILTSGQLILNGNTMTLNSGAVIAGNGGNSITNFNNSGSNYIVTGVGDYVYQNVASSDVIYPIGTATSFTPTTLNNTLGTADNYGVYVVTSTAHTLDFSGVVNKQWTVQEGSANLSNLIMTFQWNAPSDEGTLFQPATTASVGIWGGVSGPNLDVVDHNLTINGTNPGPRWVKMNQGQNIDFSGSNARTYAVGNTDVLPVELSSFTSVVNGRNINLNWETKTEKNSDKFIVERSTNGTTWGTIGSVKAADLSNSTKQYSFIDKNLQTGKYQYRLKMIDNDGSFAYSKVTETGVSTPKNFVLSQNYPNPFNPSTRIDYQLPANARVILEVYNIVGQRVAVIVNEEQSAGYYTVNFNASSYSSLTSGVYIYKLTSEDNAGKNSSSIKKMMLLK